MGEKVVLGHVQDKKPYIEVKDAIVARSGIYRYTYDEVIARGHKPKVKKDWYDEFRPASVIVEAKDLFYMVPVPPREHTETTITPENVNALMSGIVGGPIDVVAIPGTEDIALKGKIVFYTKDSYDYYMAGNKETSADYESETELVDNPEKVGYDLIMTKIVSVNNVAITARGRGGPAVRVQDHAADGCADKTTGRSYMNVMKALLGIGKPKVESFSAQVKDSLVLAKKADAAGREKEVNRIVDLVTPFADSEAKSALLSVVRDSFAIPEDVLGNWEKSAPLMDGLFARCTDSTAKEEAALAAKVTDAMSDGKKSDDEGKEKNKSKEEEEEEEKKKKHGEKDSLPASVQDSIAGLAKKIDDFQAKLPEMITAGVKAELGVGQEGGGAEPKRTLDSFCGGEENVDFVLDGAFGAASRN